MGLGLVAPCDFILFLYIFMMHNCIWHSCLELFNTFNVAERIIIKAERIIINHPCAYTVAYEEK